MLSKDLQAQAVSESLPAGTELVHAQGAGGGAASAGAPAGDAAGATKGLVATLEEQVAGAPAAMAPAGAAPAGAGEGSGRGGEDVVEVDGAAPGVVAPEWAQVRQGGWARVAVGGGGWPCVHFTYIPAPHLQGVPPAGAAPAPGFPLPNTLPSASQHTGLPIPQSVMINAMNYRPARTLPPVNLS